MPGTESRARGWALAAVLLGSGCGSRLPNAAPVSGSITLGGKPLAGAAVSFTNDTAPRFAIGTTDAEGRYTLTMFTAGDGAVVGEHRVVVLPSPRADVDPNLDPNRLPTPEDYRRLEEKMKKDAQSASAPAKIYASAETTPLRADVKRGSNRFDFDLKAE